MRIKKIQETTPLSAQVLNEASDSTKDTYSCDYINTMNEYSTSEINTGKTWMGKPIYRKIVTQSTAAGSPSWTVVNLANNGITNVDYIYFAEGTRKLDDSRYVRGIDYEQNVYIDTNDWKIHIEPHETAMQFIFVLEYTKTTD